MERYVCIHGHFYQPPRENPWLEDVELQDSAYPYHDWNARITAECYEPNTASRIRAEDGRIMKIQNNYSKISFNFGPTLMDWMRKRTPAVYEGVIEGDRESQKHFSGHGSGFAQAYNHMIMPLANSRDKYTQVVWGIRDFEYRFGRRPEGMWLPETAVDIESLDIMARQGIKFTVLAPHQAKRVRNIDNGSWQRVRKGVDPSMPYLVWLPSGRSINVFYYDGPISRAIAFERLTSNGERFAERLLSAFVDYRTWPQLVHVATDGETYGHHHPYGDMGLAYAIHHIESNGLAQLTNYGEFLEKHPATAEAEILENSSWSCVHGIERWRSNCGCNSGGHPGWNQEWRAPLRHALDWLRDEAAPRYEEQARRFLKDPWEARNGYIDVILDRSEESVTRFLEKHATRELNPSERVTALKLLELQRHAMLMYTSCGWFFDELSGLETVQVIQYAGRVIQLAKQVLAWDPEPHFLEMMANAKSNIPEHRNGAHIYQKFVKPAIVDLLDVGAHYAISSLFEEYGEHSRIFAYTIHRLDASNLKAGEVRLTVGRANVTSQITRDSSTLAYAVFYLGGHSLLAAVKPYKGDESYRQVAGALTDAFNRSDPFEVGRLMDQYFDGMTYSLGKMFRDKQRTVVDLILESTLEEVEADYRQIYDRHALLMRFLKSLNIPLPKVLHTAAEFILNTDLRSALAEDEPDVDRITDILDTVRAWDVNLDGPGLGLTLRQTAEAISERLRREPGEISHLKDLDHVVGLTRLMPFDVNLWKVQNDYYRLLEAFYPDQQKGAEAGDETARAWAELFGSLGEKLRVRKGM
ncbi:MAG: DUF3536 domain-containing protein [Firmicutes bacterium]|jgi:alpha-amylase/alpha-mannosidase (GH57 family)|nr:DUF3536 domain-containing protein [Bacillota bacterium]